MKTVSLSLDDDVVRQVTAASKRLGVSRSALVNTIMMQSIPIFEAVLQLYPDDPQDFDARRFRGETINILTEQYKDLLQQVIEFPDGDGKG